MRRISAQDTAQGNKSLGAIVLVFMNVPVGPDAEWYFKRPRNRDHAAKQTGLFQFSPAALFQRSDNGVIPFRTNYNNTGTFHIGDACRLKQITFANLCHKVENFFPEKSLQKNRY
jgi:hypothetical protein